MTQSQQKLTLSLVLVALLASNVGVLAQQSKGGAKQPTPAAGQDKLQLDGPTNGSLAAPPASIDVSDQFADGDSVKPIPDVDREAKQLGEQNIDAVASDATRLRELERKVDRLSAELKAIHEELVKLNSRQTLARPDLGGQEQPLANVGKLVVNNYTGVAYPLSINGYQFVVAPGRGEFNVPYGPVTTQILGYEAPKAWAQTDWRDVDGQQQLAIQIR